MQICVCMEVKCCGCFTVLGDASVEEGTEWQFSWLDIQIRAKQS